MNVLYTFPHRLGAGQICYTAWQHSKHVCSHSTSFTAICGSLERELPAKVKVIESLKLGSFRIPYRLLGRNNACFVHDYLVARYIRKNAARIDLVHAWPLGARLSLAAARQAGITTVLERPNAHTAFAFRVVEQECKRIGFSLPRGHEHRPNPRTLQTEEAEYQASDFLLCPSDFVRGTFQERGFPEAKLLNHQYGYDPERFYPRRDPSTISQNFPTVVFAGVAAPRKGLHIALEAWRESVAARRGRFLICGSFVPGYAEFLGELLKLPGVHVLGHRTDLPEILGSADVLVLPSFEEGSALVTYEARGSGCLLLVSNAAGAVATDKANALIHQSGDIGMLRQHFDLLTEDPSFFLKLKRASLEGVKDLSWQYAGKRLYDCYAHALACAARSTR